LGLIWAAGEEALRVIVESNGQECRLCKVSDYRDDGGEYHEDECPFAPLNDLSTHEWYYFKRHAQARHTNS
jgi:hypothetical protein